LRDVQIAMKYDGNPCGATSETKSCNGQACEKDCELTDWTGWSKCTKDCDGGTQKRQKYIKSAPQGEGACPGAWDSERLEYKRCAMHRCPPKIECNQTLDIVLLIDGSGSLGKTGWKAEIKAAQTFIEAFQGSEAHAQMAVILYSGPRTWSGVRKCFSTPRSKRKPDHMEKVCNIDVVTHFTDDMKKVKQLVTGLDYPKGSTLTGLALFTAASEFSLGRKDSKTIVVTITDGRPLSYRYTWYASRYVRKQARLLWVPVTRYAPLSSIKQWATRRWQENVVQVKSFEDLEKPETVVHIIADICPKN